MPDQAKFPAELLELLEKHDIDPADDDHLVLLFESELAEFAHEVFQYGMMIGGATSRMNESQYEKFQTWCKQQDAAIAQRQGNKLPYYGAIGGAYTFSTTATSLGMVLTVKNDLTDEELDLTEYEDW